MSQLPLDPVALHRIADHLTDHQADSRRRHQLGFHTSTRRAAHEVQDESLAGRAATLSNHVVKLGGTTKSVISRQHALLSRRKN